MVVFNTEFDARNKIQTSTERLYFYDYEGEEFYSFEGIESIEENKTSPSEDVLAGGGVYATLRAAVKKIDGTANVSVITHTMRKVLLGNELTDNGSRIAETSVPKEVAVISETDYNNGTKKFVIYPRVTFSEPNESYVGDGAVDTITKVSYSLPFTALWGDYDGEKNIKVIADVETKEEEDAVFEGLTGDVTGI